jgi:hypothetical protein
MHSQRKQISKPAEDNLEIGDITLCSTIKEKKTNCVFLLTDKFLRECYIIFVLASCSYKCCHYLTLTNKASHIYFSISIMRSLISSN